MFPFLRFPRELRDLVYRLYVTIEGGYLCDTDAFTNGRLKGIDGQPIDLALVLTCKTIADEMDYGGLALRLNPITFTTLDSPELDLFKAERPPPRLGPERRSLMSRHYGTYGETPSIVISRLEPWDIPSESEMEALVSMTAHADVLLGQTETPRTKHRFSAAAAAIYFLRFLPQDLRRQIRRIILLEDTSSVCHPESHARGLIPFCQDYPMLRVERRVALWTNVFTKDVVYDSWGELQWRNFTGEAVPGDLISHRITKNLAPWIMEASALRAAGMPDDSFSIPLESGGAPELCTSIFDDDEDDDDEDDEDRSYDNDNDDEDGRVTGV
ncbi:hypothetical protein COL922a_009632 [Colletotrichum nupharicola]|nr:hypothetical protein COL922a_009632 [Colletotrichum nupharicola]